MVNPLTRIRAKLRGLKEHSPELIDKYLRTLDQETLDKLLNNITAEEYKTPMPATLVIPTDFKSILQGTVIVLHTEEKLQRINRPAVIGDHRADHMLCLGTSLQGSAYDNAQGTSWSSFKYNWTSYWCASELFPTEYPYRKTGFLWEPNMKEENKVQRGKKTDPTFLDGDKGHDIYMNRFKGDTPF